MAIHQCKVLPEIQQVRDNLKNRPNSAGNWDGKFAEIREAQTDAETIIGWDVL